MTQARRGCGGGASFIVACLVAAAVAGPLGPTPARSADPTPPVAAAPSPGVFVPNFWPPLSPQDRPKLAGLSSIRFLTEDDHPPFGFTLADGSLGGFDIDLARAICDDLHLSCTIQARRWDTMVAALKAGSGDAAIASMAITPQSLREVDFTLPYYRTPARFVARRDAPAGEILPETIGGRRVGVVAATAHEAYLKDFFPSAALRDFPDPVALRAALRAGTIDLAFGDAILWAGWLNGPEGADLGFVGGPFTESRYFGEGAGIAVRKGDEVLRVAIDHALAELAAKGVYADLYLKYFPVGIY